MNATLSQPRTFARQTQSPQTRPVPELLLEIAYRLHATRVVGRAPLCDNAHLGRNPGKPLLNPLKSR